MPTRIVTSQLVEVAAGETAIAPRVDEPRGFAIQNRSGHSLTVSFRYEESTHVQVVVVQPARPRRRPPGETQDPDALPV